MRKQHALWGITDFPGIKKKGSTILELMVVLTILGFGIGALLETIRGGIAYSRDTENNIKAINIAREGIEAMTNIRDTNWLRFSSDKTNCWNVKDYVSSCIGNATSVGKIATGSYILFPRNGVWYLTGTISPLSNWTNYKNEHSVGLDSLGFYTQTGIVNTPCSSWLQSSCRTIFTREIYITNPKVGVMVVQSISRWREERPRSVIIETTLTNWKSNF